MQTVVYTTDGRHADVEVLNASIYSVRKNLPDAEIVVLTQTPYLDTQIIDKKVIIENISDILSRLGFTSQGYGRRRHSFGAFYKLLIPFVERLKDLDSILVLDSDVLVRDPQFSHIFEYVPLTSSEIAAAEDTNGSGNRVKAIYNKIHQEEVLAEAERKIWFEKDMGSQLYVNQGVMLWYPKNIDLEFYERRLKLYYSYGAAFTYAECDFINALMIVDRGLPNLFHGYYEARETNIERRRRPDLLIHYIIEGKSTLIIDAVAMGYQQYIQQDNVVVYESNGGDVERLKGALWSMRRAVGKDVKIFVLTDKKQEDYPQSRNIIRDYGVEFITVQESILTDLGVDTATWRSKWPMTILYKLILPFIPELSQYNNILHVDTDTVVTSSEVINLFNIQSEGYECHAAPDVCPAQKKNFRVVEDKDIPSDIYTELKYRIWDKVNLLSKPYINVGVVMFHLDEIRKDLDWYRQRIAWGIELINKRIYRYPEQDLINWHMTVGSLNTKYNTIGDSNPSHATDSIIVHYASGRKHGMGVRLASMGYGNNK